jgi:1,5-anhydro-D-fructose reductase (1,5-anhydro-D-mannitol-forming)
VSLCQFGTSGAVLVETPANVEVQLIRFGIAGFGLHAEKRLLPAFAQTRNARLTALSRRKMEQARASAAKHGVPLAFDSLDAMCSSPEVDAIFVATPNCCHLDDVLTVVRCGKPVLVEKPMAMNAGECRQMVTAAREAGVALGVAQVMRFHESLRVLRERIAAGQIGTPVLARCDFSYWGVNHARKWINDRRMGGGTIADIGVHCIDALRYVLQDEVVEVQARTMQDAHSGDVDAAGAVALRFARATLASVMVSMRTQYRTLIEFAGPSGVLRADDALTIEHLLKIVLDRNGTAAESLEVTNELSFARQFDAFADTIERGKPFAAPGEEGWRNQIIIDAAYESAATGATIDLRERRAATRT